jgi:hypothetical protein
MKKLLGLSLALTVAMFVCAGAAQADTLNIGDKIQVTFTHDGPGGEFYVYNDANPLTSILFISFCAAPDDTIYDYTSYTIASKTPQVGAAAYLYSQFRAGAITINTFDDEDAFQYALDYYLTNDASYYDSSNPYIQIVEGLSNPSADNVVILGFESAKNSKGQTYTPQSIFALTSAVPEPSFILLLATGLLVLVVAIKKM